MTEGNGRWWKVQSFSLEQIIKWAFVVGPLLIAAAGIYSKFKDVPADVSEVKRDMATRDQLQSAINQINGTNQDQYGRIVAMQKRLRMDIAPIHDRVLVYEALRDDTRGQWEWER